MSFIGYYTDNQISKAVMRAFAKSGVQVAHISQFKYNKNTPAIFYGIMRGTGAAMRYLQYAGKSFHYLDNGYFDAVYMDENKFKKMDGKYRIVRDDMIETMDILPINTARGPKRILMLPPSVYSAFMYDTIPEDWTILWGKALREAGHYVEVRPKDDKGSLEDALKNFDAVFAFNSIGIIKAMEMDKAVFTTHGIIRNADMAMTCAPYYDVHAVKEFYKEKQYTLEEIAEKGVKCLV